MFCLVDTFCLAEDNLKQFGFYEYTWSLDKFAELSLCFLTHARIFFSNHWDF